MDKSKNVLNRVSNRKRTVDNHSISLELDIIPLTREHQAAAAALVASRYREERVLNPLFPDRYESPEAVLPLLNYNREKQMGVVAVWNGKTIGFITGFPFDSWGVPMVWIPDWGHGAEKPDRTYLYRRMYAVLAQQWVDKGILKHAIMTFAGERDVMDAWFSMGFGRTNIDALRDISPLPGPVKNEDIRLASPEDFGVLMQYRAAISSHLIDAPVFLFVPNKAIEAWAADFHRQLADSSVAIWLALERGKIIGCMRVVPSNQCDFRMPTFDKSTCGISMAFTEENNRLHGVATALLDKVLEWAREKGYKKCAVDFESANIPGSSFWLSHFRPACYTLLRNIDGRILQLEPGGLYPWRK